MADSKKFTDKAVYVVLVLVLICLACTLLLAVAKDLFAVSDEVKFNRSMSKIYPGFEKKEDLEVDTANVDLPAFGEIKSVVAATDGGYVIEALGTGGYKNGSVTLYVAFGADKLIKGWSVKETVNQSFASKITDRHKQTWYIAVDGNYTLPDSYPLGSNVATGATFTSTAINNAINTAVYYANHRLFGE